MDTFNTLEGSLGSYIPLGRKEAAIPFRDIHVRASLSPPRQHSTCNHRQKKRSSPNHTPQNTMFFTPPTYVAQWWQISLCFLPMRIQLRFKVNTCVIRKVIICPWSTHSSSHPYLLRDHFTTPWYYRQISADK